MDNRPPIMESALQMEYPGRSVQMVDSHPNDRPFPSSANNYEGPAPSQLPPYDPLMQTYSAQQHPPVHSAHPEIPISRPAQNAKSFLALAKNELTSEEFRLFQDVVNQLKRAVTDTEFVTFVRKCIRLLGTRWGLVEGLRDFMPGHLRQRYTEIMIEMSRPSHDDRAVHSTEQRSSQHRSSSGFPSSKAWDREILEGMPEAKAQLSPKVYKLFQESLQQFYTVRTIADFDVVARKWVDLLGPKHALVEEIMKSAPNKFKERFIPAPPLRCASLIKKVIVFKLRNPVSPTPTTLAFHAKSRQTIEGLGACEPLAIAGSNHWPFDSVAQVYEWIPCAWEV